MSTELTAAFFDGDLHHPRVGGAVKASAEPDDEFLPDDEDLPEQDDTEEFDLDDEDDDESDVDYGIDLFDDDDFPDEPVTAALGHDVTPGHDQLHHWWVYGKGRARWHTWTELYDQLAKIPEVGPIKAAVYASAWFHERYGFWSGSDLNRVKNGKPPRGHRVGPG